MGCSKIRADARQSAELEVKHGKLENEEGVGILRERIAELRGRWRRLRTRAIVPDC